MARILLIGGHGKIALLLEPLLAAAGHHVTAVIRRLRSYQSTTCPFSRSVLA